MNRRQFLGVLLSLCTPHRRSRLLPEGSRPPDFTLMAEEVDDGAEIDHPAPVSLRSLLRRKRIIVVFSPPQPFLDHIGTGFTDRDLIVLAVFRPNDPLLTLAAKPLYMLPDTGGHVFRDYHAEEGKTTFYLVGKDGTIKMARHGCPSNDELFAAIDTMPMRRREMRERGR